MSVDRYSYFARVLYGQKMPHNLRVVLRLTGEPQCRITLLINLLLRHHLKPLQGLWNSKCHRHWWHFSVHQRGILMKCMKERIFQGLDLGSVGHRKRPDIGDFPYINLPIGNYVRSRRGQMPIYPRPNAIDRLPNIYRHFIQIAECIATDLISELAQRFSPVAKINCHTPQAANDGIAQLSSRIGLITYWTKCATTGTASPSPARWYASL